MNETSETLHQSTCKDFANVTFSQALVDGHTHCGWLIGQTTDQSGQDRALASHSVALESAKALTMSATYGPLFGGSSPSADLQESLESRLRAAMDVNGSLEYVLTWKQWAMPSGPPICALRASAHRTSGSGFTGWQTPKLPSGGGCNRNSAGGGLRKLEDQVVLAGWPTPQVFDAKDCKSGNLEARKKKGGCSNLREVVRLVGLATPKATDWKGDRLADSAKNEAVRGNWDLPVMAHHVKMEKCEGFRLNPRFSRWLMGYPAEWDSCGGMVMQSCRKLRRSSSRRQTPERKG